MADRTRLKGATTDAALYTPVRARQCGAGENWPLPSLGGREAIIINTATWSSRSLSHLWRLCYWRRFVHYDNVGVAHSGCHSTAYVYTSETIYVELDHSLDSQRVQQSRYKEKGSNTKDTTGILNYSHTSHFALLCSYSLSHSHNTTPGTHNSQEKGLEEKKKTTRTSLHTWAYTAQVQQTSAKLGCLQQSAFDTSINAEE